MRVLPVSQLRLDHHRSRTTSCVKERDDLSRPIHSLGGGELPLVHEHECEEIVMV